MRIAVFTDESGVKLPEIRKWKKTQGRGIDIAKNDILVAILKKNNLQIPGNDIQFEDLYRDVLQDYIRPAKNMYAGMFFEVRDLVDSLNKISKVSLYIISGRYGLLEENDLIIPYSFSIKSESDLIQLDTKHSFVNKMKEKAIDADIVICLLPSYFIKYLLKVNWFEKLDSKKTVILVSSKNLEQSFVHSLNVKLLERKGVARIGKLNRNAILELVKSLSIANLDSISKTN